MTHKLCEARKLHGGPCPFQAVDGSDYCGVHTQEAYDKRQQSGRAAWQDRLAEWRELEAKINTSPDGHCPKSATGSHHFILEPAGGEDYSEGICKCCGADKVFCNVPPEDLLGIELKCLPTYEELALCLPSEEELCLAA